MASPDRTALCFILGPSYHGAPMLSARLNQHPDILSLGTGNPLRAEDQPCSCGKPVSECPFWTEVNAKLEMSEDDPFDTLLPQAPFLASGKTLNTWLNGGLSLLANEAGPRAWKAVFEQADRFIKVHGQFYEAAQEHYAHKIYVDAERSNLKFMVMASMEFPVKGAIHLVRDPRGYVAAWKKYYPESTVEKLTLEWVAAHTRIKRLKQFFTRVPFLTLKYEDLVGSADATVNKAIEFMRLSPVEGVGTEQNVLKNHMIGAGPQDRAEAPAQAENWRESLHPEDQERVIRAAGPLFAEFGYKTTNPA